MSDDLRAGGASTETVGFSDYWLVLRDRRRLIAGGLALGLLLAVAYVLFYPRTYESSARLLVRPAPAVSLQGPTNATSTDRLLNMVSEQQAASSQDVAARAKRILNTSRSPSELLSDLTVTVPTNSQVLVIQFRDHSPSTAQRGAQAFVQGYMDERGQRISSAIGTVKGQISDRITALQQQATSLDQEISDARPNSPLMNDLVSRRNALTPQITALQSQLSTLSAIDLTPGDVVQQPNRPGNALTPRPTRDLLIGGLAGLLLAVALAFVQELRGDRVRSSRDARLLLKAPMVVELSREATRRGGGRLSSSDAAAGIRLLRTRLLADAQDQPRSVAVIEVGSSGSAARLAADLARSLAEVGRRVLLVSTQPHLLVADEQATGRTGGKPAPVTVNGTEISVLPRSILPPSMGDPVQAGHWLAAELTRYHIVVVETGSLKQGGEAAALAAAADTSLVVAHVRSTRRRDLREAHWLLDQLSVDVLAGVVEPAVAPPLMWGRPVPAALPVLPKRARRSKARSKSATKVTSKQAAERPGTERTPAGSTRARG